MELVIYLIQSNLILVALYSLYKCMLEKETFFVLNRVYLMGSFVVAAVVPLVEFPVYSGNAGQQSTFSIVLPEIRVSGFWGAGFDWQTIVYIYWPVAVLLGFRLMVRLIRALRAARTGEGSFSFFGIIRISDVHDPHKHWVLAHESAHARQLHSLDLLSVEIVHCLCWFNPILFPYRRSLRLLHEYLADHEALRQADRDEYSMLLVNSTLHSTKPALINTFHSSSLLKNRITMMYQTRSNGRRQWKYTLALPVIAFLFFGQSVVSAQERKNSNPAESKPSAAPTEQHKNPEVMAEFPGGQSAMMKYVVGQVHYPEGESAEGVVMVSFVVSENGSVEKAVIKKSVSPALDREALRVVNGMPKWTPALKDGKPVSSEMVLPVRFQLAGGKNISDKPERKK